MRQFLIRTMLILASLSVMAAQALYETSNWQLEFTKESLLEPWEATLEGSCGIQVKSVEAEKTETGIHITTLQDSQGQLYQIDELWEPTVIKRPIVFMGREFGLQVNANRVPPDVECPVPFVPIDNMDQLAIGVISTYENQCGITIFNSMTKQADEKTLELVTITILIEGEMKTFEVNETFILENDGIHALNGTVLDCPTSP